MHHQLQGLIHPQLHLPNDQALFKAAQKIHDSMLEGLLFSDRWNTSQHTYRETTFHSLHLFMRLYSTILASWRIGDGRNKHSYHLKEGGKHTARQCKYLPMCSAWFLILYFLPKAILSYTLLVNAFFSPSVSTPPPSHCQSSKHAMNQAKILRKNPPSLLRTSTLIITSWKGVLWYCHFPFGLSSRMELAHRLWWRNKDSLFLPL